MNYAGIDLGATHLRVQVVDDAGTPRETIRRRTPAGDGPAIEAAVVAALETACTAVGVSTTDLGGVGIGSIGPLDNAAGAVIEPANVPATRIDLVDAIDAVTGCPITLCNDATAGVVAERRFAEAPPNTVYLTLSSGIGAGVVVDGTVLAGDRGNVAEVGHFVLEPGGRPCGCGGTGHWEAYCGGEAIPDLARDLADRGIETDLELADLTAPEIYDAARTDPLASAVIEHVADYNAIGVADVVHAFAPSLVSIGGAVAIQNVERVVDPIRRRVGGHLAVARPTIRSTPLGRDAVLRGAVALALENRNG